MFHPDIQKTEHFGSASASDEPMDIVDGAPCELNAPLDCCTSVEANCAFGQKPSTGVPICVLSPQENCSRLLSRLAAAHSIMIRNDEISQNINLKKVSKKNSRSEKFALATFLKRQTHTTTGDV